LYDKSVTFQEDVDEDANNTKCACGASHEQAMNTPKSVRLKTIN